MTPAPSTPSSATPGLVSKKLAKELADASARAQIAEAQLRADLFARSRQTLTATAYAGSYRSADLSDQRRAASGSRRALPGTANDHLDARTLQDLARDAGDLSRNNPLARALIGRYAECVAGGIGPRFRPKSSSPEWNAAVSRWFERWSDTGACDVRGQSSVSDLVIQMLEGAACDGDVLVVAAVENTVPKIQLIEGSRIRAATPAATTIAKAKPKNPNNGERINNGVIETPLGAPVRYVLDGDLANTVEAADARLFRFPLRSRPNQTRGEPMLTACVPTLERIDAICQSTAIACQVAANLAMIIKTNNPGLTQGSLLAQAASADPALNANRRGPKAELWGPGSIFHLEPNEDVSTVAPTQPAQQLDAFLRLQIRIVGADVGLPMELITLDASETNYHGFKSAVANAYRGAIARGHRRVRAVLQWAVGFAIRTAAEHQQIVDESGVPVRPPADADRHEWIFPPPPLLDPAKDIQASVVAIGNNLCSASDAVAELWGDDYMEVLEARAREVQRLNELGLESLGVPGQTTSPTSPTPSTSDHATGA